MLRNRLLALGAVTVLALGVTGPAAMADTTATTSAPTVSQTANSFTVSLPGVGALSFMVDPAHSGQGVGRALGAHVIAWARQAGYRAMQFNAVVETNVAAVRLWEALGFEILTTVPGAYHHRVHGYVGLHVMYQRLN